MLAKSGDVVHGVSTSHRFCTTCPSRLLGDEQHSVFEYQALQAVHHKYLAMFGAHAQTMIQFMWRDDLHTVAIFIRDCFEN
jgi:hypothetical protein